MVIYKERDNRRNCPEVNSGKEKTCTNAYSIFRFENSADNRSLQLTLAREHFSHNRNNTDTQDM